MICKHVIYMTGKMKMRNIVFLLCMLICMSTCMDKDNGEESPHRNITNDGATADITANAMADEDVKLLLLLPTVPLPTLMISILYGISGILIM